MACTARSGVGSFLKGGGRWRTYRVQGFRVRVREEAWEWIAGPPEAQAWPPPLARLSPWDSPFPSHTTAPTPRPAHRLRPPGRAARAAHVAADAVSHRLSQPLPSLATRCVRTPLPRARPSPDSRLSSLPVFLSFFANQRRAPSQPPARRARPPVPSARAAPCSSRCCASPAPRAGGPAAARAAAGNPPCGGSGSPGSTAGRFCIF